MFRFLTPSSIIIILAGVVMILIGGWYGYRYRNYFLGGGLFFLGVGNLICGLTNGFTMFSPRAALYLRGGVLAYVAGILLTAYYFFR